MQPLRGKSVRRTGVTLTEVLVAIFIMGIGLLSLLTMFPLGAMNMQSAVKDQRAADATRNAAAIARILNVREDPYVFPNCTNVDWNPPPLGGPSPPTILPPPPGSGPSYPVYVDPQGVLGGSNWIGIPSISGFRRAAPSTMYAGPTLSSQLIERWTKVLDDMAFDDKGQVKVLPGNQVQRETRYSYAFLCRQVRAWGGAQTYSSAVASTIPGPVAMGYLGPPMAPPYYATPQGVELTVVLYDRRPNLVVGGAPVEEKSYRAVFGWNAAGLPVLNMGVLIWPANTPQPAVKRGTWILDATVTDPLSGPRGYFYRVANVNTVAANTLEIEFQQNVRATTLPMTPPAPPINFNNNNVAVVMESVVEVFDKGTK